MGYATLKKRKKSSGDIKLLSIRHISLVVTHALKLWIRCDVCANIDIVYLCTVMFIMAVMLKNVLKQFCTTKLCP